MQVPVLAARPSALTVLPIQPSASMMTEPSAQLQEQPEDVSAPFLLHRKTSRLDQLNLCAYRNDLKHDAFYLYHSVYRLLGSSRSSKAHKSLRTQKYLKIQKGLEKGQRGWPFLGRQGISYGACPQLRLCCPAYITKPHLCS